MITHTYEVAGGVGARTPGAIGPDELDGRADWVEIPARGEGELMERLEARLGSEARTRKVLLAVLAPVRGALEGPALAAILAHLPHRFARELREAEWNLDAPVREAATGAEYLAEVSRLLQRPPRHAAAYVLAVLAAAHEVMGPAAREVAGQLPPDLADLWRGVREPGSAIAEAEP
ncbi:conserved hypothetical protein [Anaeromyxobacter dehalogenans 2CP-1]|uniref:DUF2267 domain-containing protein n=1 Tax=Anaeromyxobacter dehalogenans (strain ATCC BAA-258 / DSM 21875 / 2CP-1) TaxID=455488 RepID=B8J9T3_ANAD2|nr:DUF2267 domain-containing protein [Anaeromyxobacter dehalogenans]ACL63636.1 conserved hypothetical protein [Anaeromyxobacter dehalogenans 2CP-1]